MKIFILALILAFSHSWAHANETLRATTSTEDCFESGKASSAGILSETYGSSSATATFLETGTLDQITEKFSNFSLGPWGLLMHPSSKVRLAGVNAQIFFIIQKLRAKVDPGNTTPFQEWLVQLSSSRPVITAPTVEYVKATLNKWRASTSYDDEIQTLKNATPFFCSYFAFSGCEKAMRQTLDWMHPHLTSMSSVLSMLDLWEKMMLDPEYVPGLAKATTLMNQRLRILRQTKNQRAVISDVLSDLIAGYRAVGKSNEEAIARAYDVMGLYGTRGASLAYILPDLTTKENLGFSAAFAYFSAVISYLDTLQPEGRYYSVPPSIIGTCPYGKPYHFWLSAYLTKELQRNKHTKRGSEVAPHIVSELYEFNSITRGRNPTAAFTEPLLSLYNNGVRINLTFNDAGVLYQTLGPGKKINLNNAIESFKKHAEALPPMTRTELQALLKDPVKKYQAQRKLFAPDTLIREIDHLLMTR